MKESEIVLSREQAREADRIAIAEYGIPGIVLMENAGRSATEIIRTVVGDQWPVVGDGTRVTHPCHKSVACLIFCGPGNNGGDGYVIARHLANAGYGVGIVLCADRARIAGDAAVNLGIVEKMGIDIWQPPSGKGITPEWVRGQIPAATGSPTGPHDEPCAGLVLIDALLGTGSSGDPREPISGAIEAINRLRAESTAAMTFAIDIPSGLDADSGAAGNPTVRADQTITFMAAKRGFFAPGADAFTGRVHVAEIGIPRAVIDPAGTKGTEVS